MTIKTTLRDLRRVYRLLGKRKWGYLVALLSCAAVEPTYQIVFAFANRGLLNSIELGDTSLFFSSLLLVGVVLLFHFTAQPFTAYHYEGRLHYPIIDIKLRLLQHIVKLPMSYFETHHSGDIMTRVSDDVDQLSEFYLSYNYDIVSTTIWGVGSIVSMYLINPLMATLMICLGLLTAWGNTAFTGRLAEQTGEERQRVSRCNEKLSDIVPGLRVIKAFNQQQAFAHGYDTAGAQLADSSLRKSGTVALRAALSFLLSNLNFLGGLSVAAYLVALGRLDFGSALAVIILQNGATTMFSQTGRYYAQIHESLVGVRRIFEVLDTTPEEAVDATRRNTIGLPQTCADITFQDIHFSYAAGRPVLQGLNLQLPAGRTTALVGASGGGKSTITKLILGLYRPDRGKITIGGLDIAEMSLAELRSLTAYVPQDVYLFNESIADNIRIGRPDASDTEVMQAAQRARAHDFILELPAGYATVVGEGGHGLSGGQRQRIAIARAILKDAPILLLDEATSALDSEVEEELLQALRELAQGKTVVTVAHRQSAVIWADEVQVIGSVN